LQAEQRTLFELLAAVLALGNVRFAEADAAEARAVEAVHAPSTPPAIGPARAPASLLTPRFTLAGG